MSREPESSRAGVPAEREREAKLEMTESDVVREVWEHRDDPDEWSEEAVDIEVAPSPSHVLSFRLSARELHQLQRGAAERGETISEYIREALRLRQGLL